jgi:hypothetical protein
VLTIFFFTTNDICWACTILVKHKSSLNSTTQCQSHRQSLGLGGWVGRGWCLPPPVPLSLFFFHLQPWALACF